MTICRTAFCQRCADRSKPYVGDYFLVYGRTSEQFHVHECDTRTPANQYGFTPHIFNVKERNGNLLIVEKVCAIHDCGVWIGHGEDEGIVFHINNRKIEAVTIEQWNELVKATDLGYEV